VDRGKRHGKEQATLPKLENMVSRMEDALSDEIASLYQQSDEKEETRAWLLQKLAEAQGLTLGDPEEWFEDIFREVEEVYLERKRTEVNAHPYAALLKIEPSAN